MSHFPVRAFARVLALVAVTCTSAFAQAPAPAAPAEPPRRPNRPVYGGNERDRRNTGQSLELTLSGEGTYDDNAAAALQGGVVDPLTQYQGGGFGGGGVATLTYTRTGRSQQTRDRSFNASWSSGVRSFYDNNNIYDYTYVYHSGGVGVRTKLGRSTGFSADQRVAYQPYFSLRAFPVFAPPDSNLPPVTGVDYAINNRQSWRYDTHVGIDQGLTRHSRLSVGYTFGYTDFTGKPPEPDPLNPTESFYRDFATHNANASYSYDISTRTSLNASYGYSRGSYGYTILDTRPMENHNAEFGVRHERRLSPTRRMTIGASLGANYTKQPALLESRRNNTTGSGGANFGIDLGRSWVLGADYRRGVNFYEGFGQPFYYDRVNVSTSGYLTPALRLTLSTGYDTGSVGVTSFENTRGYDTYLAQAQLQYGLARNIAVYGGYTYYRYLYDRAVLLPAGIPRQFDRQSVSVGISFWMPLLR